MTDMLLLLTGLAVTVQLVWLFALVVSRGQTIHAQALKIADLEERRGQEMPVVIEPAAVVGPGHARKGVTA